MLDPVAARQLNQNIDLAAWWYQCPVDERHLMRALAWDAPLEAAPCYAAISGEIHRALVFG